MKHFHDYFDTSFISAYLPLKTTSPQNETEWLTTLALETMQALSQGDFSMYRLPKPDIESHDLRDWLMDDDAGGRVWTRLGSSSLFGCRKGLKMPQRPASQVHALSGGSSHTNRR